MIALQTLAQTIENGLNASEAVTQAGIRYVIFSDAGKYKKALETRTQKQRYTNGVLRIVDSSVVPTQSLTVATQQASLEICVALPNPQQDDEIIALHRSILDGYFTAVKVQLISDNGKTYSVSSKYSLADSGTIEQRPKAGSSYTFTVHIEYSFIEGGLSSYDCVFTLDGVQIPYTTATITRRPTTESNPYSNSSGQARNVNTATALSFDFQVPAQTAVNGVSEVILAQILDGDMNTKHELTVALGANRKTYEVMFGQTDIIVTGVDNAGHNISLIEAASSIGG